MPYVFLTQKQNDQLKTQVKTKGDELWAETNEKTQLQRKVDEGDATVKSQKVCSVCQTR